MRSAGYVFKVLCPEALMQKIMGRLGQRRDQLEEQTGARIRQSEDHFPNTPFQAVHILGDSHDVIMSVLDRLLESLIECGEEERATRPPTARDEPHYIGKEPGEYLLRVVVAAQMIGGIIGPKGSIIKKLREDTQAKVFIEKNSIAGHHMLRVVAGPEILRGALNRINETIQEEATADWYPGYASIVSFGMGVTPGIMPMIRPPMMAAQANIGLQPPVPGGAGLEERERSPRRGPGAFPGMPEEATQDEPMAGEAQPEQANPETLLQLLIATASELPLEVLEQEHVITCDLPRETVSGLIGKQGVNVQTIRRETGTKIHFEEAPSGELQQTLLVQGPLLSIHRAHALMMRRYHEVQEPPPPKEVVPPMAPAQIQMDVEKVKAMEEELKRLKQQLDTVQKTTVGGPALKPQPQVIQAPRPLPFTALKGKGKGKDKVGKCKGGKL